MLTTTTALGQPGIASKRLFMGRTAVLNNLRPSVCVKQLAKFAFQAGPQTPLFPVIVHQLPLNTLSSPLHESLGSGRVERPSAALPTSRWETIKIPPYRSDAEKPWWLIRTSYGPIPLYYRRDS